MYRLMKSERFTRYPLVAGSTSTYRQIELNHFPQLGAALAACEVANHQGRIRHYVLNDSGKEYYEGTWID